MRINEVRNNLNYNQSFGAVKFYPAIKEWNPRILETVLDSIAIKRAIEENESKGIDTLIYYINKNKYNDFSKKINEFGVVKLKESTDNFSCRSETYNNLEGINFVIDFIKRKDSGINIPQKIEKFNKFLEQICRRD